MRRIRNLKLIAVSIFLECTMFFVSCDTDPEIIELPTEIEMTTSITIDLTSKKSEYNAEIPVGVKIPIKVTDGKTYQWVSLNPSVAYVENDSIDAVSVGKADVIDRNGAKATIHVTVVKQ